MNKAVLLSVLVFPGAGHILLKKYPTGISLIIASAISLTVLIYNIMQRTIEILNNIPASEILKLDIMSLSKMLTQTDTWQMQIATTILLILWLISIVDSYRISRKQAMNLNNIK